MADSRRSRLYKFYARSLSLEMTAQRKREVADRIFRRRIDSEEYPFAGGKAALSWGRAIAPLESEPEPIPTRQLFVCAGTLKATAASAVSIRKVNVSCRYNFTAVSVWLK
jgi:hypothetical protein